MTLLFSETVFSHHIGRAYRSASENSQSTFNDDRLKNINSAAQHHCTVTTLLSVLYNEIGTSMHNVYGTSMKPVRDLIAYYLRTKRNIEEKVVKCCTRVCVFNLHKNVVDY